MRQSVSTLYRVIEDWWETVKKVGIPAGALRDQVPGSALPPTGNLGTGYTPGDGSTTTGKIADDAVTYAKMQNISAASKLLGRGDSGSGNPQEITIGSGLSMSGTTLSASGSGSLTVEEVDGSPTDSAVTKIKFPNGTLSISSHEATYTPAGGGSSEAHILIVDSKSTGTHAGASTSGSWATRDLNTEKYDTGSNASVATNQITLAAGTYRVRASAPAVNAGAHQARLYDITNSAVLLSGTSEYCPNGASQSESVVIGRFTLAGSTVLELQHRVQSSQATFGLGVSSGAQFTVTEEIFATVELTKE